MTKAETGVGGSVVSELAYRNDYIAVRGQAGFAEEAWQRNKCAASIPSGPAVPETSLPPTPSGKRGRQPVRSGGAVY